MRIAIASFKFASITNGGASTLVGELARAFKNDGHQVLVMTASDEENKSEYIDGIRVERRKFEADSSLSKLAGNNFPLLNHCLQSSLAFYAASEEALRAFQPDVLEIPESYALGLGFAIAGEFPIVARCVCPGYLLAESGELGDYTLADQLLTACLETMILGCASGIISISKSLANELSNKSGIPLPDFVVIPVPLTRPVQSALTDPPNSEELCFPRLLYWGRVEQQKGCDILIESLPMVAKRFPNFRLELAGTVSTLQGHTEPYSFHLLERTREFGLTDKVHFKGFLSAEELDNVITRADICVLPSKYETAGYTAIEAMARSKCVLTTNAGGLPEYVKHLESGYLVPPYSPSELAKAIILLSEDSRLRDRLAQNAREHILSICDVPTISQKSVDVYAKAIVSFGNSHRKMNLATNRMSDLLNDALQISISEQMHLTEDALTQAFQQGVQDGEVKRVTKAIGRLKQCFTNFRGAK